MFAKPAIKESAVFSHCLDGLRVCLGVALFVKGLAFLKDVASLQALLVSAHAPFAAGDLAHLVAVVHLAGGLLLAFGMFTRLAAAVQVPNLLGAVVLIHAKDGLFTSAQTLEFSLLVLFLLGLFTLAGAGPWSVDYHFAEPATPMPPPRVFEAVTRL
jgi:uncharacterized membrane protein YphA (DoxX/SURF4 family)